MVNLAKILPYNMTRYRDMYELARSLHGCQETRSWQDFQLRLNLTWLDISNMRSCIFYMRIKVGHMIKLAVTREII